jgi:hypothetical protein
MQTSLLTTLASKHRSTVTKIAAKHKAKSVRQMRWWRVVPGRDTDPQVIIGLLMS